MFSKRRFSSILILLALLLVAAQVAVAAQPQAGAKVAVKEFRITGAEAIPAAELQSIVAPFIGKEADLNELRKAADAITEEYSRRGYNLARAVIPEQNLTSGVVEIAVLEARIGKIRIEGNNYYSNRLIERYFAGVLRDKAVKQSSLEKALLLLGDQYPDIQTSAGLRAGDAPGSTDIVIAAKDIFPAHLAVDYNNFGVHDVSRHILGVQLDVDDPWFGSHWSYRENTGWDPRLTHSRRASVDLPINSYGTRFGGYYAFGDFAVGGDLADLDLQGDSESWGLSITHPFIRTRFHKLTGEFGFDLRDSSLFIFKNTRQSRDRIRLLKFGFSYEGTDTTGRNFASAYLFQGLGTTFGGSKNDDSPPRSRDGAGNSFTYAIINLSRLQQIGRFLRGIVKTTGQISSASLVASEQFALGGPNTVRGYAFKEFIGDNAFNAGAELRLLPLPGERSGEQSELLQLSLGLDYGLVQQKNPQPGLDKFQSFLGYGPGVRLNLPFNIASRKTYYWVNFDVGFPITPAKTSNGSRPVYYVQTGLRF